MEIMFTVMAIWWLSMKGKEWMSIRTIEENNGATAELLGTGWDAQGSYKVFLIGWAQYQVRFGGKIHRITG